MLDIGTSEDFGFRSNSLLFSNIKGSDLFEKYQIQPIWSSFWDFKILSIFLNQLTNFEPSGQRPTRIYKSINDNYRTFKFIDTSSGNKVFIHISFQNSYLISVFVSREMLLNKTLFDEVQNGPHLFTYYLRNINMTESSKSILNSETLVFFDIDDFSKSFIYFSRIMTTELPNNRFSCFLFEFSKFYLKRPNPRSIVNIDNLTIKTKGYLKLITIDKKFPHLFKLNPNDDFYILRGCYISPFALSILHNDKIIDGIMLDGTFKAIKNYVTCFITCIIKNTSIPIGFTFSHIEDEELYKLVFRTF